MVKDKRLYEIIGVSPNASNSEIRREYRLRALSLHPDKNRNDEKSKERFQELQKAYEILRDEESRRLYDETGIIDGDDNLKNFDDIIEFFKQFTNRLTEKDIKDYKKIYRGSNDEWEDIHNFYIRFNGNCKLLLEYIPFSEPEDIDYYIGLIKKGIKDKKLPNKREFENSIKELKIQAKKWKLRNKREKSKFKNSNIDDLVLAIKNNSKKRFGTLENLISKHSEDNSEEIDEKIFQEIQGRLINKKKKS